MAWPKGRRRAKDGKPAQETAAEAAPALGHPAAPESAPPMPDPHAMTGREAELEEENRTAFAALKAVRRTIMLHRLKGPASTLPWDEWRRIRHYEDMRDQKLVWHIQAQMTKDGASIDQAEAYLDEAIAARG